LSPVISAVIVSRKQGQEKVQIEFFLNWCKPRCFQRLYLAENRVRKKFKYCDKPQER